ncbi:MAG: hypothetical protein WBM99_05665 [Psychromonas sp.]
MHKDVVKILIDDIDVESVVTLRSSGDYQTILLQVRNISPILHECIDLMNKIMGGISIREALKNYILWVNI